LPESFASPVREAEPRAILESAGHDTDTSALANDEGNGERVAGSSSPAQALDGQHRRRRRRRGRRGRRREGEQANGGAFHQGEERLQSAPEVEEENSIPRAEDERADEQSIISANSPSSPQWTLNDFGGREERSASIPAPQNRTVEHHEPERHQASSERAEQMETELPAEETGSKEARKGWWQRRFKM